MMNSTCFVSEFSEKEQELLTGLQSLNRTRSSLFATSHWTQTGLTDSLWRLWSEAVCWCDCVMIMKLGPQKPVSVTERSPEGLCHSLHSSQPWWFSFFPFFSSAPSLAPPFSLSICFTQLPFPLLVFAFAPFQLFINTWWMLQRKKVSYSHLVGRSWIFPAFCTQSPPQPAISSNFACTAAGAGLVTGVICQTPTPYYLLLLWTCQNPETRSSQSHLKPLNTARPGRLLWTDVTPLNCFHLSQTKSALRARSEGRWLV